VHQDQGHGQRRLGQHPEVEAGLLVLCLGRMIVPVAEGVEQDEGEEDDPGGGREVLQVLDGLEQKYLQGDDEEKEPGDGFDEAVGQVLGRVDNEKRNFA
jgi:hypothetical protein